MPGCLGWTAVAADRIFLGWLGEPGPGPGPGRSESEAFWHGDPCRKESDL